MDRPARTQVNVNTLEIPADLAYIISKLDDGQQAHSARHVSGVKGHVQPQDMNHALPQDIDSHAFNKYVNIYFKEKSQMRKEPITSPLLAKLQDRDAKDAIAVYKLILRYMNDTNLTEQREKLMADYIVQKGMSNENLRDEVFGQLCTQTWLHKDNGSSERGWQLMCHALSAFQPSPTLSKYLLKYVSDQGYNGYKAYCQHKLLHSLIQDPPLPRNYPPSLLEWLAARKRAQMALAVTFADGETTIGHVDSWTTGEEFVSHLLRQRQLAEGDHGWTVVLRDDNNMYELMGYDYVLDLLAEMEVHRGFPYTLAPLLVTTDHSRDIPPDRKKMFWDSPHNPELPRLVELSTEELRDPVPVSPRPAQEPHNFFRSFSRDNVSREDSLYASHDAMSSTSRLNSRSLNNDVKPSLSNNSILNVRYTGGTHKGVPQSSSPEVPSPGPLAASSRNGSGPPSHRPSNASSTAGDAAELAGLSMSRLNNRYTAQEVPAASPAPSSSSAPGLATTSRLNQRYANNGTAPLTNGHGVMANGAGVVPNGVHNGSTNGDDLALSTSKMNRRYAPGPAAGAGRGAAPRAEGGKYGGDRAERMSIKSGNPTDMDQWLDQVFDPILDGSVDDLSDPRAVQSRLKGGGRGLPGLTTQPGSYNPAGPHIIASGLNPMQLSGNVTTIPTFSGPATGSIPLGSLQMLPDPNQIYAQQLAAQQHQNQQQQQAQAMLSQQQAQQAQQQAQHAQMAAQALQHENYDLHNKLHQKDLEKQLLEKTLEYERLKSEIATNPPTSPHQLAPSPPAEVAQSHSRPRSTSPKLSPATQQEQVVMRNVTRQAPSGRPGDVRPNVKGGASGEIDTSRPGGVKTLKGKYEKSAPPLSPTLFRNTRDSWQKPQASTADDRDSTVQFSDSIQQIPQSPPVAAPHTVEAQRTSPLGSAPPPAPPPPPSTAAASPRNSSPEGTRTSIASRSPLGDDFSSNSIKTPIKLGTIQWPPPSKESVSKEKRHPNKLRLEQNIILPAAAPQQRGARSMEDAHATMMATIRARNPEAQPKLKLNQPDPTPTVNMSERKNVLAQKLTLVGVLKGPQDRPARSPSPPLHHAPPPPPPPLPPSRTQGPGSSPSPMSAPPEDDEPDMGRVDLADLRDLEKVKTELFSGQHGPYLTYSSVPWALEVRKEVFTPTEMLESPALIHLVFCQITQDVFSNAGVRIPKEEKTRMRSMLENNGVSPNNVHGNHKTTMKKMVIDTARDWPYYFARLFPVNGGRRHPAVQVVGVSHSGVKLLAREKDLFEDNLHVVDQLRFEDIIDVSEPKPSVLQIHVNNDYVIVYTPRAAQIKHMIDAYCIESEKNVMYVRAVKDYTTRDPTLLYFHEGDVIKLTNRNMAVDKGWLYGSLYGRTGLFPEEYIKPLAGHELDKYDSGVKDDIYSDASIYSAIPDVQKFSMMEFAMLHFRESPFRYEMIRSEDTGSIHGTFKMISSLKAKTMQRQQSRKRGEKDWTWKEQADMIKWTKSPIQASLLKFETPQMNKLALESFISIMRYMGDYPLARGQKPIDCVYTILKACHNFPEIKDEVYCQLAKQTTNNRSTKPESLQLGWRLLSIITAYFACTDILKPYLFKYLETTALDLQRPHQTLAAQCLQNLRQTFRYGGRKNVPSRVELEALTRGRNTKRQMCVMPGGVPVVLNIRSCSVVLDAIDQICGRLEIQDPLERDEFTIFYVIENGSRYLTLNREEYIFDITTELANQKKEFYLLFQRTSWVFPLHLENNPLYIDVMFHQCIPDYLDGFLLPMPTSSLPENVKVEIARLAALQIRANDLRSLPKQRDVMASIPRTAHGASSSSSWMGLVERELVEVQNRASNPNRAKVLFLEKLSRWPLFGSTFFNIKSVNEPRVKGESLLAINRAGMHFLHPSTHETLQAYPFTQVVSTRRFHGKDAKNYLEMKVGDLMNQKITRIETDQGVDISALIGQYIHILKRYRN